MTFFEKAANFPPILCRLMAQEKCRPLDAVTIAGRGGRGLAPAGQAEAVRLVVRLALTVYQVEVLSEEDSWDGVSHADMEAFLRGCGTNFDDPKQFRRMADYLRKDPMFNYLRRDPHWKELYLPLLLRWLRAAHTRPPTWPPLRELVQRLSPLLKHHDARP